MIGRLVRNILKRYGLFFWTTRSLPRGIDVYADFARLTDGLRPDVIVDVGANVGQTCLEMVRFFPSAIIYAFEPIKATFDALVVATRDLPNVKPYHLALGAAPTTALMSAAPGSVFNTLKEAEGNASSIEKEMVAIETLDRFCEAHSIGTIDLLKTDTEGFDLEVLRGATDSLANGRIMAVYSEVAFNRENRTNTDFFLPFMIF